MYCPVCSSQISAMDARCLSCNTLLIESSEKKSDEFKEAAGFVDKKTYYSVGAAVGFLIALAFFYNDKSLLAPACSVGAVIGGLIGKEVAKNKWK